jgi:hypothetical protein
MKIKVMKKEQQDLLDKAYENYSKEYEKDNSIGMCLLVKRLDGKKTYRKPNKEMFVDLCYDKTFSEKWGLKIEERELSLVEMIKLAKYENAEELIKNRKENIQQISERLSNDNIPTKLITVKYKNETIESYE